MLLPAFPGGCDGNRTELSRAMQILGVIAGLWTGATRDAGAATIFYSYQSTCLTTCYGIGLPVGGPVVGRIEFDASLVVPNGTITMPPSPGGAPFVPGPVRSFDLTFGTLRFSSLSGFDRFNGTATLDASTSAATSFAFAFAPFSPPNNSMSSTSWVVMIGSEAPTKVVGGPGTLTRETPIGEPPTILVLSAGLLGLFLRRAPLRLPIQHGIGARSTSGGLVSG